MRPIRTLFSVAIVALLTLLGGRAHAALRVVATTPDLAAIARQVGGPAVQVTGLALPTQDPHFVDARPNLAVDLNKADLLLVQGLDLEIGWLPTLQTSARNPKIMTGAEGYLDCSTFVPVLEVPSGTVSRAQGDIHRGGNPHYLMDPRDGARVARGIAARLAALDPADAAMFTQNAAQLESSANELGASIAAKFAALDAARRDVVVYHRSWIYLESWLGLSEVGAVEPKPGIPPDPAHVAELLQTMKSRGTKAILSEEYYPRSTSKLLADKTGAALVVVPGGTPDNQGYLTHVQEVANTLYAALSR